RRGMTIQWGPSAWNAIVGYRRWPVPRYGTRPEFCLIFRGDPDAPGKLVMSTPQFRLTRLSVLPVATGNAELRRGDSDEPCRCYSWRQPHQAIVWEYSPPFDVADNQPWAG